MGNANCIVIFLCQWPFVRVYSHKKPCKITKKFRYMQINQAFWRYNSRKMCDFAYFFEEKVTSHPLKRVPIRYPECFVPAPLCGLSPVGVFHHWGGCKPPDGGASSSSSELAGVAACDGLYCSSSHRNFFCFAIGFLPIRDLVLEIGCKVKRK